MNRFRDPNKFRIGDGLAQFEFALRRTSLVHNTEKINVINLTKTSNLHTPKSDKKHPNKNSVSYDPRRTENANYYYSDFLEAIQLDDDKDSIQNDHNSSQFEVHPPNSPYHYSPLTARSNKNSKSKSAKVDRLNDRSNLRKKKKSSTVPNFSLSSFRTPEQLRQLMLSFSQLEYVVRDFLRNNQYYIQFAEKWKYFSDSFDRFIETASLHFSSNFNYNSNFQCSYRQITKATPVYLTSEIIVNNFSDFIQQSTKIQSLSSSFLYSIQREFDKIHKLIQKTRNAMTQNRYKTDVPCIKLEEFQNNVIALNDELFPKDFLNSSSNSNLNLNKKRLHKQICELNREVFEIFHKFLKYSFINLAIKIQIRTELSSCISNIEESLLVAERTGTFIENLKDYIASTNKELTKVLNLMGFPYHIDLNSFNKNDGTESKISNGSTHTKDNKSVRNSENGLTNDEIHLINKNNPTKDENNSENENNLIKYENYSENEIIMINNENSSENENNLTKNKNDSENENIPTNDENNSENENITFNNENNSENENIPTNDENNSENENITFNNEYNSENENNLTKYENNSEKENNSISYENSSDNGNNSDNKFNISKENAFDDENNQIINTNNEDSFELENVSDGLKSMNNDDTISYETDATNIEKTMSNDENISDENGSIGNSIENDNDLSNDENNGSPIKNETETTEVDDNLSNNSDSTNNDKNDTHKENDNITMDDFEYE